MTVTQHILTILAAVAATVLTRYISFIVFPAGRKTPQFVRYLGNILPPAVIGMLVIYCYKGTDFTAPDHGIPAILAGLLVALLHKWKGNLFLSILGGTVLYMVLIRLPIFL